MFDKITKITKSAKRFIRKNKIEDVTFILIDREVAGCCIGAIREIEPVYHPPTDASRFLYCRHDGFNIFISRQIRIIAPLYLTTEGVFRKRLYLGGATIPI